MVKNKKEKYSHGEEFSKKVGIKESRRIKARQKKGFSIIYGLSMFGMVGWSVTIPTIILTHWSNSWMFECMVLGKKGESGRLSLYR